MTDNTMTDNTMTNNTMTNNTMTDNTMTTMTDNTMTDNTIKEMPTYDRAICNMKSRTTDMFRGANRYGVLEDSDDKEQGTECPICQYEGIKPRKFNLIKTVKQPSCELSNRSICTTFALMLKSNSF